MINIFRTGVNRLIYARECIYYQTYLFERKRGVGSLNFAAIMVAMFDSPLLFSVVLMVENIFSDGVLRETIPASMTDPSGIFWMGISSLFEVAYYRIRQRDIKIINKFGAFDQSKLKHSRFIAYWYASTVLLIGMLLVFTIVKWF